VADEARLAVDYRFADEAVANRERAARKLLALVHLVHHFDHLAYIVIEPDDEARGVHDPGKLAPHSTTQHSHGLRTPERHLDGAHDCDPSLTAVGMGDMHHWRQLSCGAFWQRQTRATQALCVTAA
jgi:hypothetical protein